MLHEYLMFWLRETLSNVVRNRLMSVLAVTTVTVGLFILGGFYLTVANLKAIVAEQTDKLELSVYLQPDVTDQRRKELYDADHIAQVSKLTVETKDQALVNFKREYPTIPVDDFAGDQNPFSDVLHMHVRRLEDMSKVRDYMASLKGVKAAEAPSDVGNVLQFNHIVSVVAIACLLVLGLAILLIIHNAIRLTIFARRREISIMEMVGATRVFISLPFLLEGLVYGASGAIVAGILLNSLVAAVARLDIPLLKTLVPITESDFVVWQCTCWMLAAGMAFGLLGSWISLSRSLDRAAQI